MSNSGATNGEVRPTYALEHLATFKVKNEAEIRNPREKMRVLFELDKSGSIWPQKMYLCFSGQWLVMLDNELNEIENFPGSLILEPTAFISDDPSEGFNNILVFTVSGAALGNTEMHMFQVIGVSAVYLVEDLKHLSSGGIVNIDRNKTPLKLSKPERSQQNGRDHYGIAAEAAAELNAENPEQTQRDIQVLNHCFEDVERFIARLQYASEALNELEARKNQHNLHGEGLLILRSRPPVESEFFDILAKAKLALVYLVKLKKHFNNVAEPIRNLFISLQTIINVCNDVHIGANIPENVVNPLLRRETIKMLEVCLRPTDISFWQSLGPNWTKPKEEFRDHKGAFHPIFYDDWSPDWVVDEDVPYSPAVVTPKITPAPSPQLIINKTWLSRLQSRNVKIAEVKFNKTAGNEKELTVTKGEYLEIIDDSRNWWKARNSAGSIGYVPHTILAAYNFEPFTNNYRDTISLASTVVENDNNNNDNNMNRNTMAVFEAPAIEREALVQEPQLQPTKTTMRSYSAPIVPIPPPMPPPSDSVATTPSGTITRNMVAAGTLAAMRARNDETSEEALVMQSTVNDELKMTLLQREKRRDLEILVTPQIYINQHSKPSEVEEWLRAKGFSNAIVSKLKSMNGEEIFALTPHVIEGYFGQKDSRRLISQIVLQKNFCEYKTIRSSELNAKLAKARQKADNVNDRDEIF